ncbi:hypothetical protein XfCFBP8082_05695 [Xylella fastidiosa subsp. fastidiosa]|nr:hypothetical protein [Xylella fastidiosa subsp. fastidiosa]QIS24873.1 hypothetical protein F7G16_00465 [Xylella fastidiosa]RUA38730.1 hypothetical protein DX878_03440 [Xylella fastidiosa subsp. fastidiosa]RWA40930.1 hypothetical protein XfCFBP8082_05695 [Xylella fastidiosa subsp. fastidiosa]RWA41008.1 hypothetical protein XfCFBP8351_06885 [Xylella fastidiosa subsp. fastidiosa]
MSDLLGKSRLRLISSERAVLTKAALIVYHCHVCVALPRSFVRAWLLLYTRQHCFGADCGTYTGC